MQGAMFSFPVLVSGLPWTLRTEDGILAFSFWIFLSWVFYAWFVQYYSKEVFSVARFVFDFRSWGKPLRVFSSTGKVPGSKKYLFFFLALAGLVWFTCFVAESRGAVPVFPGEGGTFGQAGQAGGVSLLAVSALSVLVFYSLRALLLFGLAQVFEERKFAACLWRTGLCHDLAFSLLALLFLAAVPALGPEARQCFFQVLLVLFLIFLIIKILHLTYEGGKLSRFSRLHIFVYLCALEILLPLCLWQAVFRVQ